MATHTHTKTNWLIPAAIIFAGIIIAISVYSLSRNSSASRNGDLTLMRPVNSSDHVLGDPAAPVMIVEYADIDSAYSKDFQTTMEQAIKDYGSNGSVAWVFRHFPLIGQDPYSEQHAEAAECTASQTPTDTSTTFFGFIDAIQAATPGDSQFNPSDYPTVIASLGLDDTKFEQCLKAGTYRTHVEADYDNALMIGATGSPFSVLLVKGQKPVAISGSIPYFALKQIIDKSIASSLQSGG